MLTRRELSQPKSTHYSRSGITHQPHRPQHPPCGRCAPLRGASLPGLPAQTCAGQAPTNVPGLTPTTRQCGRGREQAPGPHTAGRPGNDKVKGGGGTRRGTLPHSPRDSPPGPPAPPPATPPGPPKAPAPPGQGKHPPQPGRPGWQADTGAERAANAAVAMQSPQHARAWAMRCCPAHRYRPGPLVPADDERAPALH